MVTALENLAEKDLTLEVVKQRLLAEESKRIDRQDDSNEDIGAAFIGVMKKQYRSKFFGKCHRCGRPGHMKRDCRCDKSEDIASFVEANSKAVTFLANRCTQKSSRDEMIMFCVDSGCSNHLVKDTSRLQGIRKLRDPLSLMLQNKVYH